MADRRLQVFHAVVKYGSFTRAADALFMTQPAVTFQIKQLEQHFNTRLLDRGHGKIELTPAGKIVLAYAEKIHELNGELEARVSELTDELSGVLAIGTSTTIAAYWLPALLERFKSKFPRVIPRVVVGNSELVQSRVLEKDLDVGLIEIVAEHPGLERHPAGKDELRLICRPDHPLAQMTSVTATDLVEYPFIHRDPGNAIRLLVDNFLQAAKIGADELHVTGEVGSLATVKHLAASGVGVAIASMAALARDLREGRLTAVPLDPPLYTPLEVILPRDKFRSRLVAAFAEFALGEIRSHAHHVTEDHELGL